MLGLLGRLWAKKRKGVEWVNTGGFQFSGPESAVLVESWGAQWHTTPVDLATWQPIEPGGASAKTATASATAASSQPAAVR